MLCLCWFDGSPGYAFCYDALKDCYANEHLGIGSCKESLAELSVIVCNTASDALVQFNDELKRDFHVTPASYLELMKLFVYILKVQQNMLPLKMKKYTKGLKTLANIKVAI